jgi:hypothetical protein
VQGFLHIVELEGFDDRFDLLHCGFPEASAGEWRYSIGVTGEECQY